MNRLQADGTSTRKKDIWDREYAPSNYSYCVEFLPLFVSWVFCSGNNAYNIHTLSKGIDAFIHFQGAFIYTCGHYHVFFFCIVCLFVFEWKLKKVGWVDLYSGAWCNYQLKLEDDLAILFTTYLLVSTLGADFTDI